MQKILKIFAVAQFYAKPIQNRPLAAVDSGLIGARRVGHFGFCAFLPKQLFDQPSLFRGQGAHSTAQIVIRTMCHVCVRGR